MANNNSKKGDYSILTVVHAKEISTQWLKEIELENVVTFGLPEIDDRYHIWRVPLLSVYSHEKIGEIVIDAVTSNINKEKTTSREILEKRLLGRNSKSHAETTTKKTPKNGDYRLSPLGNTIALGDSEEVLKTLPEESIDLVFTSPPYYNARPEYSDFLDYDEYLLKLRKVIRQVHRVLADGKFFVINVSPVLVRRSNRNESSKRIAVPFDIHRIFIEEGYDFIDDIIWVKPEGAGWATGRGRRFSADKNPLQYKAVPVTEYLLVYRKTSDKLIDWYIRNYPDKKILEESKVPDSYERTNIWKIKPSHDKKHPAIFPMELAEKVIQYYSFKGDVVLDPFAGIGTVGQAATELKRKFVLIEINQDYVNETKKRAANWLGKEIKNVNCVNTSISDLSIQTKLI